MGLANLIDNYQFCERALSRAIGSEAAAAIRELDIRMHWLRSMIREHPAASDAERSQQISFFIKAIAQASDLDADSPLFEDLRTVIERRAPFSAGTATQTANTEDEPEEEAAPAGVSPGPDAFATIERADIRIIAVDRNLNCVYASPADRYAFPVPLESMIGANMRDVIGHERFDKRAKAYFDRCLAGDDQCYCIFNDLEDGRRQLLECRLMGQRDTAETVVGILIVLRDLTANMDDPIASAEANRI